MPRHVSDFKRGVELFRQNEPFYALLAALIMKADTDNTAKIRAMWPEFWDEINQRYNMPGGLLPGEIDFVPYALGPVYTSVCTSLTVEEAAARLNAEHPTGIDSQWALSKDEKFAGGGDNGAPCHDFPQTHKHYLFQC